MFVAEAAPQAVESVRTAIVLIAVVSVVFWKALLKFVLMAAVITVIVLLASGAMVLMQNIHHVGQ
jgi:hypothetical protein